MGFLYTLRSKRIRTVSIVGMLFVTLWMVQGGVGSTDLRRQDRLLFWSFFDFNVDAATQQFGPLVAGKETENICDSCLQEEVVVEPAAEEASYLDSTTRHRLLPNVTTDSSSGRTVPSSKSNNSILGMRGGARRMSKLVYTLFQDGDGSEKDPDGIPTRFLLMHSDDRRMAQQSLVATLDWRRSQNIDDLLNQPQQKFDICKVVFPHYFLDTRDDGNHVVFVQHPPKLDLAKAHRNGLKDEELLMHYVYVNEYMWQVLEKDNAMATMTSIIDLQGLQLSVLRQGDIISIIKKFVTTMDSHYPQRAHKTLLLNVPKWFNAIYKILSPLMRDTTKNKIEIHVKGKQQDDALTKHLGKDAANMLPKSFWSHWQPPSKHKKRGRWGGKRKGGQEDAEEEDEEEESPDTTFVPPESQLEKDLRKFVLERTQAAGIEMQMVQA